MALIELQDLTRHYGRRRGVEGLSFSVEEGALFGFLGPNGAGKTTTIRILLGFLRPNSGSARVFGRDCWRDTREIKRQIGYVPGDLRLPNWMNGATCLSLFGKIRRQDLTGTGRELAAQLDLDLNVRVRDMSRGMRQKLGLILAMAHGPRLLVLDEPTSALDPLMQRALHELLRARARQGHTIFFSSHSLSEVEELCDRVAIVRAGRLVAAEALSELRRRAGHEVTIRWQPGAATATWGPPEFLRLTRHEPALWQGTVIGPVRGVIDFLAGKPVEEVSLGRPDLETLFRQFYDKEGETAS